jgi:hypothetical protein
VFPDTASSSRRCPQSQTIINAHIITYISYIIYITISYHIIDIIIIIKKKNINTNNALRSTPGSNICHLLQPPSTPPPPTTCLLHLPASAAAAATTEAGGGGSGRQVRQEPHHQQTAGFIPVRRHPPSSGRSSRAASRWGKAQRYGQGPKLAQLRRLQTLLQNRHHSTSDERIRTSP